MTDAPDTLPPGPWEADPTPIGGTYFIHSPTKTVAAAYDLQTAYAIAAIPEREREIERLRGSNKQLADIVTDQEDRRLKAEARVAELTKELEANGLRSLDKQR